MNYQKKLEIFFGITENEKLEAIGKFIGKMELHMLGYINIGKFHYKRMIQSVNISIVYLSDDVSFPIKCYFTIYTCNLRIC